MPPPVTVPIDDSHVFLSPYNIRPVSSSLAIANAPHGYLRLAFSGTSLLLNLSGSYTCPRVACSVDGGTWSYPRRSPTS